MTDRRKIIAAAGMFVVGGTLIAWSSRDPDRGFRDEPTQEQEVKIDQIPAPVRATVRRESAGGTILEIQKETKRGTVKYDIDIAKNCQKIALDIAEDGSILERKVKTLKPKDVAAHPAKPVSP